jgi:hypothetical protein
VSFLKKITSLLLVFVMCFLFFDIGYLRAENNNSPTSIFFGTMFQLGNGDYYICPEFVNEFPDNNFGVKKNIAGIKVELPNSAVVPKNGEKCLVAGDYDFESGCVTASVVRDKIEWLSGELKEGKFFLVGKKYSIVFVNGFVSTIEEEGRVELFGERLDNLIVVYAICPSQKTKTTITGLIKEVKDNRVVMVKKEGSGRKARHADIEIILEKDTPIFEGRNRILSSQIIPGRVGVCTGIFDYSAGTIRPDTLICNIDQATDGGRIIGVITGNKDNKLKVKAGINQLVHSEFTVLMKNNCWVVWGERILDPGEYSKIPINFTVEIIGIFGEENKTIIADTIRINPSKPFEYLFGVWDEETESITDFYGDIHRVEIVDTTWISAPGGSLTDGRLIHLWMDGDEAIACYVPELGIMGVRVTGWLKSAGGGTIQIDCLGSMNYDLQGKIVQVLCGGNCMVVKGGQGIVDINTLPAGTLLHCWGVPDLEGNLRALLVSVY